jgi:hypothetical protein
MNPRRTEHQADSRTEQSAYQPGLKNMPDTLTPPPFELCAKNKLYSSEVIAVHSGTKSSAVSVMDFGSTSLFRSAGMPALSGSQRQQFSHARHSPMTHPLIP